MKTLFSLILLFASTLAVAGPPSDGTFFDPDNPGEGIDMYTAGDCEIYCRIHFKFFTYLKRDDNHKYDAEILIQDDLLVSEQDYRRDRYQLAWFTSSAHPMWFGESVGVLYMGDAYQDPDFLIPYRGRGRALDIGLFVLTQTATGYTLTVLKTGDVLDDDARIYHTFYNFTDCVFGPACLAAVPVQ
jgi:hypothetical protein